MNALPVIDISNNLGDAKSLITHPATTTHRRLEPEARAAVGITDGMLRVSVGLEDVRDLVDDLDQALSSRPPPSVAEPAVSVAAMSDVISVQRLVPAPPEPIFDLLADPAGHAEIDGGGTVKGARSGGRRLALGDRFGMDMHLGVAYSTRNTVIELDENRRIAWQTTAQRAARHVARRPHLALRARAGRGRHPGHRDLGPALGEVDEQAGDQATMAASTRHNMERTLARIEELVGVADDGVV